MPWLTLQDGGMSMVGRCNDAWGGRIIIKNNKKYSFLNVLHNFMIISPKFFIILRLTPIILY